MVLKVILNMDMHLVLGVVMMCSELKDPDKLVHVGCVLLLCGTLKCNSGLDLKFYPE